MNFIKSRYVSKSHKHYDIIIIGAGIIGAAAAYHAQLKGLAVLIMDTNGPFSGASGASDGAVSVCTKSSSTLSNLALAAIDYYDHLSSKNNILENVFHKRPSYYFSTNDKEDKAIDDLSDKIIQMGNQICIKADKPGNKVINGTGNMVKRILEVEGEGHMLGYSAVNAYLRSNSIDRVWPCDFKKFEELDSYVNVYTNLGTFKSNYLIIATGTSPNCYISGLEQNIIMPRSGQLIITDKSASTENLNGPLTSASYLLSKSDTKQHLSCPPIVIDPLDTGQYLIGSSREDNSDANKTDFFTVNRILSHASSCFPPLLSTQVIRVFAGVRAAVKDGHPIVGPISKGARVLLAKGFEGDGICLSALIGRELIDFIGGNEFSKNIQLLSPQRFMA